MSLEELSHDPFDVDEFVERLAWRSSEGQTNFEPMVLHGAFCQMIQQLSDYERKLEKRNLYLEKQYIDEETKQKKKVQDLLSDNQKAYENFQELDGKINHVATKVVHLGDQLESVNIPRARNSEALHMMRYLNTYFDEHTELRDDLMSDPRHVAEAAELVQKLQVIVQELPQTEPKFVRAKESVMKAYNEVEEHLISGFLEAYNMKKIEEMRRMCDLLKNFRRYNDVIDRFIAESQRKIFGKPNPIEACGELCLESSDLVSQIFFNPESVMTRFVTTLFLEVLRNHIDEKLACTRGNQLLYLNTLSKLYAETDALISKLGKLKLSGDNSFLLKLINQIFGQYLSADKYTDMEFAYLKEKTVTTLAKYYDSKNHVKRQLQAGGISDLRRDLQAKIHINIGPDIDNYTGDVYLSQEVAISILQEFKSAYGRLKSLVPSRDLPQRASQVFQILTQYLCSEFVDYAIELALYHCPLAESRTAPNLHFFAAVADTSAIIHLFEKQFADSLLPIVNRTPYQQECTQIKTTWIEKFEQKLVIGLERTVTAVSGYIKNTLYYEQKRTDFKPEDMGSSMMHSQACALVISYLPKVIRAIKQQLDGKNSEAVLTELGIRFHKIIYEHLLTFQYNSVGAMLAICDVNEYRVCIKQIGNESVVELFDVLHALCNLLVVPADNLKQICTGEPLNQLDRPIVQAFVQLRADYKNEKLAGIMGR